MTGIYWIEYEKPANILNEGEICVKIPIAWDEDPNKKMLEIARQKFGSEVVKITRFCLEKILSTKVH